MSLPQLPNWSHTSRTLHQASMLLGAVQAALLPQRNNYLYLPMHVQSYGISSQRLPQGGEIRVDYKHGALIYRRANGTEIAFEIHRFTQASLFEALLTELQSDELAAFFADVETPTLAEGMMLKLNADTAKPAFLSLDDVTRGEQLSCDPQVASDYADALYTVFTGIARFRARLEGHMTPIVVWPEHFDLSTLWFPVGNPEMDDHKAHMNFGFAPFSPGYDQPYLYAYAYPYPDPFSPPDLPSPARWNREGWTGVVVDYKNLARQNDPAQFVEEICQSIYDVLLPLVNEPVAG